MHLLLIFINTLLPILSLASNPPYHVDTHYEGKDFLKYVFRLSLVYVSVDQCVVSYWNFETGSDPTHGSVTYQSRSQAITKGLAVVEDKTIVISVDAKSAMPASGKRDSWVDFYLTVSVILTHLLPVH